MRIYLIVFIVLCSSLTSMASEPWVYDWKVKENLLSDIKLNKLRFTNRAQCALDSNKPTNSAFIMLDSINPGKSIYRLARHLGTDTQAETKAGIERLRYSSIKLIQIIAKKLLVGELPLLKEELSKYKDLPYASFVRTCEQDNNCEELQEFISNIWNSKPSDQLKNDSIDKADFLAMKQSQIGCYYLKKFSPIQAHLFGTKPNEVVANRIGEVMTKYDEYLTDCDDLNAQENMKISNYQIDIIAEDEYTWNKVGFDFWNSLKIYFSWAFRYSNEIKSLSFPYHQIVKSISIEESMLFIPNGCKSINSPKCDAASLNLNSMRYFAQADNKNEIFSSDMLANLPDGATEDLLARPIVDVNTDILKLGSQEDANAWAEKFRDNFTKTRGFYKLKFINAINKLKIISSNLEINDLKHELKESYKLLSSENKDQAKSVKDQFYYMCSEYLVAKDDKLSFLNQDLDLLKESKLLDKLSKSIGGDNIEKYFTYFEQVVPLINTFCDNLQKNNIWEEGHVTDRLGFTSWYQEFFDDKHLPKKTNIDRTLSKHVKPILTLAPKGEVSMGREIICVEGANCARHILDSIVDIYSTLKYADSLLPNSEMKSPALLNPYAERMACDVYDPWKKTRTTVRTFFHDIGQAVLMGIAPSPIYISAKVKEKEVVSFKSLIEDGKVSYDPIYDPAKIQTAISLDFGALIGVPCAISISNSNFNPGSYYTFNGISLNACTKNESNSITVNSASEMNESSSKRSGCYTCAINLQSAIGVVSNFHPITRSAYFLIRGTWNFFKGMRDPHNIPKDWEVDVNQVHHTYRKYGLVNKYCTKRLLKGEGCLDNACENSVATHLSSHVKGAIEGAYLTRYRGNGFVKLNTCDEPLEVKLAGNRSRICDMENGLRVSDLIIPEHCKIKVSENE